MIRARATLTALGAILAACLTAGDAAAATVAFGNCTSSTVQVCYYNKSDTTLVLASSSLTLAPGATGRGSCDGSSKGSCNILFVTDNSSCNHINNSTQQFPGLGGGLRVFECQFFQKCQLRLFSKSKGAGEIFERERRFDSCIK